MIYRARWIAIFHSVPSTSRVLEHGTRKLRIAHWVNVIAPLQVGIEQATPTLAENADGWVLDVIDAPNDQVKAAAWDC